MKIVHKNIFNWLGVRLKEKVGEIIKVLHESKINIPSTTSKFPLNRILERDN